MTKIITGEFPNSENIALYKIKAEYLQEKDICNRNNDYELNSLKIKTENYGGGTYYVLSTKRWAFNNIEEIVDVLKNFIDRFENKNDEMELT